MSRHACTISSLLLRLIAVVLAFGGSAAHAAIYKVGADGACDYTKIADAVAAATVHTGSNAIHIASNQSYTQQAITITASIGQYITITGGFADCSQVLPSDNRVIIDGDGGAPKPVFDITVNTGSRVNLFNLTIQKGDVAGNGKGGGIYFKGLGDGTLQLDQCTVLQNTAGNGGGIYAERAGTGSGGNLVIGHDVDIVNNTARFDGGGVVADGTDFRMTDPNSYIAYNHAPAGYGGGLLVRTGNHSLLGFLGSSGLGNLGAIYLNDASWGGGIALMGSDNLAQLTMYSADALRPVRIKGNTATVDGGGIYLGRVGDNPGQARLFAENIYIEDNIAPHGAAIAVRYSAGSASGVFFNYGLTGVYGCTVGKPCGSISGNAAINSASQPSGGVVEASGNAFVHFHRMTFEDNSGQFVFFGYQHTELDADHVAITGNTLSGSVIAADFDSDHVDIENTTIAGNAIGTQSSVLRLTSNASSPSKLYRSIIWQPLKTTVQLIGDPLDLLDDMVSEGGSLNGGTSSNVFVRDPRFVDPGHGDYSLRAASPAVDFTLSVPGGDLDLYSNRRDVDLPVVANFHGRGDLGAIERQTLQPLVLNSDFDADLRLWNAVTAGVTTRDTARNVSGAAGSGSAHISVSNAVTGTQTAGLVQCVQLPGPGVYSLNGWGHGTGTAVTGGDIAELYWEYRKNGGDGCTGGVPNATGTQVLSNGNSWSIPATPASITVNAQDWTPASSITVTLIAVENGSGGAPTNAWFDGITLRVNGDDRIFADGFEKS